MCAIVAALLPNALAANWTVARVNHMVITPPGGVTIGSMSGVTYLGSFGGAYRFVAAMEEGGKLLQFDVGLSAAGAITGFSNVSNITLNANFTNNDFEGIAYTNAARNSVFLCDENQSPGLREIPLNDNTGLKNVAYPTVFTHDTTNISFESLTRSLDAKSMWMANEDALTVDGVFATQAAGSVVRLLKFNVSDNTLTPAAQYAYPTEPIHPGTLVPNKSRNGLSELVVMPDGTLLALERSLAVGSPIYLNRIYETNFAGATDVSVGALGDGLISQSYTPVGKSLLWQGAIDLGTGQNMEGLSLGPRLANGSWVLLGVVDNGDGGSMNTVVAFTATAVTTGDFDADGDVDGADLVLWQRGNGKPIGAKLGDGDGDRDGDVDDADLQLWKGTVPAEAAATALPEPASKTLAVWGALTVAPKRRRHTSRLGR